jgi:hypothetical protein
VVGHGVFRYLPALSRPVGPGVIREYSASTVPMKEGLFFPRLAIWWIRRSLSWLISQSESGIPATTACGTFFRLTLYVEYSSVTAWGSEHQKH